MASIRKHGKGWQAQVTIEGVRRSKKLPTRAEAKDWAAREEYLIRNGEGKYGPGILADLFIRYAREVSPGKRGARWEILRLEKLARDPIGKVLVKSVRPGDFAEWRDRRLREVSPPSVRREMILMSSVLSRAVKEWEILPGNPLRSVSRPKEAPHRDRLVSDDEMTAIDKAASSDMERRVVLAARFAVETAMRAGEIASLRSAHVTGSVARLPMTKNGHPRDVPLSAEARAIWAQAPDGFGLSSSQISTTFSRLRKRAKVDGATFHDLRHVAITRLSKRLHVLALARMVGHRDTNQLSTYYNETASDLARLLD